MSSYYAVRNGIFTEKLAVIENGLSKASSNGRSVEKQFTNIPVQNFVRENTFTKKDIRNGIFIENEENNNEKKMFSEGELLHKVLKIVMKEKLYGKVDADGKVVEFKFPKVLRSMLEARQKQHEFGCSSVAEAASLFELVTRYSVRTQHPYFYNQLYGGVDEVALAGAWLLEAINTNVFTFEVAPVLVVAERLVLEELWEMFGWQDGDGIFCPGGSLSNMYSLHVARHRFDSDIKRKGMYASQPLAIFTSDQCHYSVSKAAFFLGFGLDSVVVVQTDSQGAMRGPALAEAVRRAREEGKRPFYVNATAGTTVLGAFDALQEIADVCEEEKLWLHVDACWGGAAIFSKQHRALLDGTDRADSLAWNPHKMLAVSLQCSAFLVREKGLLHQANCSGASYLFQLDKFYDVSYDTGDKSLQCGRKGDALKMWLSLRIHGKDVLERRVDAAFAASRYLEEEVNRREGFQLVREGLPCTNVCFWFVPPCLRETERGEQWWSSLGKVAPLIKEQLVLAGSVLVGYQPLHSKDLVNFFRMVNTCYPVPTNADMDHVLDEIERWGKELKLEQLL